MVCFADPFAALQGMSAPAAAPVAAPQAQAPNLVDLDDLLSPTPAQGTQQQQLLDLSSQQHIQHPGLGGQATDMLQLNATPASNAYAQQPASMPQQQQQPQQQQPKAGGPAPMAPRGNAAVEQSAGRRDPFADLFS